MWSYVLAAVSQFPSIIHCLGKYYVLLLLFELTYPICTSCLMLVCLTDHHFCSCRSVLISLQQCRLMGIQGLMRHFHINVIVSHFSHFDYY